MCRVKENDSCELDYDPSVRCWERDFQHLIGEEYYANYCSRQRAGLLHIDPFVTCAPHSVAEWGPNGEIIFREINKCFSPDCSKIPRQRKHWESDPSLGFMYCEECHRGELRKGADPESLQQLTLSTFRQRARQGVVSFMPIQQAYQMARPLMKELPEVYWAGEPSYCLVLPPLESSYRRQEVDTFEDPGWPRSGVCAKAGTASKCELRGARAL